MLCKLHNCETLFSCWYFEKLFDKLMFGILINLFILFILSHVFSIYETSGSKGILEVNFYIILSVLIPFKLSQVTSGLL